MVCRWCVQCVFAFLQFVQPWHLDTQNLGVFAFLRVSAALNCPSENDILLDTQSTHHLFKNAKLLHDLHISPTTIQVQGQVEGASFSTDAVGRFLNLEDEVFHSCLARANVLSFSRIWKQFPILIDNVTKSLTVVFNDHRMVFQEASGLFIWKGGVNSVSLSQLEDNEEKNISPKPKLKEKRKKDDRLHSLPRDPPSPPPISPSQLSTKGGKRKNGSHPPLTLHPSSKEKREEKRKNEVITLDPSGRAHRFGSTPLPLLKQEKNEGNEDQWILVENKKKMRKRTKQS